MNDIVEECGPCTPACKHEGHGAAENVELLENISVFARAATIAPPNDGVPHGMVRRCRSCGAVTTRIMICDACIEAERAERAAALDRLCRRHGVQLAEDLPPAVLQEHRAAWGRC